MKVVRDFFWPILDPLEDGEYIDYKNEYHYSNNELEDRMKYIDEHMRSEDQRRQEVESKATIFIGGFGVAVTVLISLMSDFYFADSSEYMWIGATNIFMFVVTIIYMCAVIYYAIKTLERRTYHTVGFPTEYFKMNGDINKKVLIEKYNCVKKNQKEINIKVDYMTMAQLFFKRVIVSVAINATIVLAAYLYTNYKIFSEIMEKIQNINLKENINMMTISLCISIISCVISIIALSRTRKYTKNIAENEDSK